MVYAELIGLLTVWVLLPLIPAILIYRLFPNTAVAVSGPLANLTVNASGAFAAYMIVFLVTIPRVQDIYNQVGSTLHSTWTISGKIKILDKDGKDLHAANYFRNAAIRPIPPAVYSFEDPSFTVTIPDTRGGPPHFTLVIPDFGVAMKEDVNSDEIQWYERKVELKDPIEIRERPRNTSSDRPLTAPAQ